MFILDYPEVSDYLKETIRRNDYPVVDTPQARHFMGDFSHYVQQAEAVRRLNALPNPTLYSNSENSLEWIHAHLSGHPIIERIHSLKDKYQFRTLLSERYPGFYFQELDFDQLTDYFPHHISFPLVIKPSVGFFSLGVRIVNDPSDWNNAVDEIHRQLERNADMYPRSVFDGGKFLIENYIDGEEYAMDTYYDGEGNAVLMNIFYHRFSGGDDVRDRVYTTSALLMERFIEPFTEFLTGVGQAFDLRNFPVHAEFRISSDGSIVPLELNPIRFGGWCSTPDLTRYAYGFNPYEMFMEGKRPDWKKIIAESETKEYSIVGLDNSTGFSGDEIKHFDYDRVLSSCSRPLEMRRVDYKKYSAFGILFVETDSACANELDYFLSSDLSEFVTPDEKG